MHVDFPHVDGTPSDIAPARDTLGGRIGRARDSLDLSTAQLARRLGVKTATMQAWESDRSEPRSNKLVMLAGILNVSPSWLLVGRGDAPAADAEVEPSEIRDIKSSLSLLHIQARLLSEQIASLVDRLDEREGNRAA